MGSKLGLKIVTFPEKAATPMKKWAPDRVWKKAPGDLFRARWRGGRRQLDIGLAWNPLEYVRFLKRHH